MKQTWLCKKKGRYVALKITALSHEKWVHFDVVESTNEKGLGFDPAIGSKRGNATCPFCGTVSDVDYIKSEGCNERIGQKLMAVACTRRAVRGKVYISADSLKPSFLANLSEIPKSLHKISKQIGITIPNEPLPKQGTLGFRIQPYGFRNWGALFSQRQMLCILAFAASIREAGKKMFAKYNSKQIKAIITLLGAILDRLADFNSSLCVFNYTGGRGVVHTFGRHALPMVWDFGETNPFNPEGASWISGIEDVPEAFQDVSMTNIAEVKRGSASSLPWPDTSMDAVVTDPPYYDNIPYADISDFFYVWLKRTIGEYYPEHFAGNLTPKRSEIIAEPIRYGGDKNGANQDYERMMAESFKEVHRILKPGAPLVIVYAHKTTLGWSTLVDALRTSGFMQIQNLNTPFCKRG